MNFSKLLLGALFFLSSSNIVAQFSTVGTAVSLGNDCFRLTQASASQNGSIWSNGSIDLNQNFDLLFDVNLGSNNGGADGMVFVLAPSIPAPGQGGGGIGYLGMSNTIAIEIDTYDNGNYNDIFNDHMAIISNGSTDHNAASTLSPTVNASATNVNIEDGQYHTFRVKWDANTQTLEAYFDCVLRVSYTGNIVANQLNNNSSVKYGFTASTGALSNLQSVCFLGSSNGNPSADSLDICLGDSTVLNPSNMNSNNTFSWSANVSSVQSNGSANIIALAPQWYAVTITTSCSTVVDSFYINPVTSYNASFQLPDTVCIENGNIQVSPIHPGGTFSGTGIINSTNGIFNTDSAGLGTHLITYTISGNCANSSQDSIHVMTGPDPTIQVPSEICQGDTITLNANTAGGTWAGVGIINAATGLFNVSTSSGTFNITYSFNQGCFSADTLPLTVYAPYTPDLPNLISLCENDTTLIVGDTTIGNNQNPNFINWFSGPGIDSNGFFNSNITGTGGPFTIYLNQSFNDGRCLGTDSVNILVYSIAPSQFSADDYCDNQTNTISLNPAFPNGDWLIVSPNNSNTSWNPMSFSPSQVGPGTFYIVYEIPDSLTSNGCGSSSSDTIHIYQTPDSPIIGQDTFCYDSIINLSANSNFNLFWSTNNNFTDTLNTGNNHVSFYPNVGQNQLWLSAVNEICYSPPTPYNFFVYAPIQPSFTVTPEIFTLPTNLTFTVDQPNPNHQYIWLLNGLEQDTGIQFNYSFNSTQFGDQTIQVIESNSFGCFGDSIAIYNFENSELIHNIPNVFTPNNDGYNDVFGAVGINGAPFITNARSYHVEIYNRWGNLIYSFDQNSVWNGEDEADGAYFYIIEGTTLDDENFKLHGSITLLRE